MCIQFPWFKTNWHDVNKLFTDWPFKEENIQTRRKYLDKIFKSISNIPSKLSLLSDKFMTSAGPLDFMILAVIKAPYSFLNRQKCTQSNNPGSVSLTKRKIFIIESLCFFDLMMPYRYATMLDNDQYILCVANYFEYCWNKARVNPQWFNKIVIIERRVLDKTIGTPDWSQSKKKLSGLNINTGIGIEDFRDSFQVNFADPIPGGTLPSSHGDIVQEEILFLIYPELFIVPLLVFRIGQKESIIVRGITRTNNYSGYRNSFKYRGGFTTDDKDIGIIFMDAVPGGNLNKDLNKAFLGFSCETNNLPIATGHWGCGAFGGDKILKSIIQLIAGAEANRNLNYAMFDDPCRGFKEFYDKMILIRATVGEIYLGLVYATDNGKALINRSAVDNGEALINRSAVDNKLDNYYKAVTNYILALRKN